MNRLVGRGAQTAGYLLALMMVAQSCVLTPAIAQTSQETDAKSPMKGRVETSGARRVARPQTGLVSGAAETGVEANARQSDGKALDGQIDSDNFALGTDEGALNAGLNTDIVGGVNNASDPPSLLRRAFTDQTPAQQEAAVDYATIESAYSQSIPPLQSSEAPLQSALIAIRAQLNAVLGPTGMPLGAAHVDMDNCDCGTPMPSHQCMGERTSSIYGGSYSGSMGRSFGGHGGGHCGGHGR